MKRCRLEMTKKGYPAMWECWGKSTNTGSCTIVGGKNAEKKKPLFIKTGGELSNRAHALFVLNINDIIVEGYRSRDDFEYTIYRFIKYEKEGDSMYGEFEEINHFSEGEWDRDLNSKYEAIVKAAHDKMCCYHCRSAYYYKE